MPPALQTNVTSAATIRSLFNSSQYPVMIANCELRARFHRNQVLPDPLEKCEPPGTRSQTIRYFDQNGQWVVLVHRYLRPDGLIGASGKADPLKLRIDNTIYTREVPNLVSDERRQRLTARIRAILGPLYTPKICRLLSKLIGFIYKICGKFSSD